MRAVVVEEAEYKRAFDECLLKIEKALREPSRSELTGDPFRTATYYVRELQARLEGK